MKKLTYLTIPMVMLALFFVGGCSQSNGLLDVTFLSDYETDLDVVVTASSRSTQGVFDVQATIDPMSDPDFARYANNIQSVEIMAATGTINTISADANLVMADINVSSTGMAPAVWQFTQVPLQAGTVFELTDAAGQLLNLSNIINQKQVFTVSLTGETDQDDFTFTMHVFIRAKVTANPL